MGNQCEFPILKQLNSQKLHRNQKRVSNAPTNKYALRLKNKFPPLPQLIQQLRKKLKSTEIQQIIKECPIYFIYEKSAVYQGHWKQGQPHGYGRVLYKDFSYYEGLVVNSNPDTFINETHHEDGFYVFADGSYYRGQFKQAKFQGRGVLVTKDNQVRIAGQFKNGLPHGKGTQTFIDYNERYQGEFINGQKSGKGKYYIDDFLVYEGDFSSGNMHGQGRLLDYDGSEFVGRFNNGKKVSGQMKSIYGFMKGNYNTDGQESGEGYYEWQDGKFYVGGFKDSRMQGEGRIYLPNGRVIQGRWLDGHNKRVTKIYDISLQQLRKIQQQFKRQVQFRDNENLTFNNVTNRRLSQINDESEENQ